MHEFKFLREMLVDVDPGSSKEMQLLVKLEKAGTPLMVNLCSGDEPNFKAMLMDPDAVFDILAKSRKDKTTYSFPYFA